MSPHTGAEHVYLGPRPQLQSGRCTWHSLVCKGQAWPGFDSGSGSLSHAQFGSGPTPHRANPPSVSPLHRNAAGHRPRPTDTHSARVWRSRPQRPAAGLSPTRWRAREEEANKEGLGSNWLAEGCWSQRFTVSDFGFFHDLSKVSLLN